MLIRSILACNNYFGTGVLENIVLTLTKQILNICSFFERFKLKRPLWGSTLNNSYFVIQEKYNIGKITLGLLVLANSLHCKSVFLDTAFT